MPFQVLPGAAIIVGAITVIGGAMYAIDRFIDPRNLPNNARGYDNWNHQMWLRDERLKKEFSTKGN